jgi:outer membrane protein TolC
LIALKNVDIIDKNIQNITSSLAEAKEIYKNGFIEQLDVDRLELSLENLRLEQQKLSELIEVSYTVLKYQMAYDMSKPIEVTEDLETVVNLMSLEPQLSDTIDVAARPEYRLLSKAIDLDNADLDRIEQGNLPTLRAFANYGQNLNRNNLFDGSETGFLPNGAVGLSARIPIYNGGSTKAKVQQKKILIEQREIELSEFERAMKLQVINARTQMSNAQRTLTGTKRSLELNEKIYSTTQIKYREGVGSSVEVTQAEASLYQAQANYINALYDLLTSKTELDIATGQILKTFN